MKSEITAEQRERFTSIFGKLELHFTGTAVTSLFEGDKTTQRFRVVASDQRSIVLAYGQGQDVVLEQLVFEGNRFFKLAGNNIEYFQKLEA